MFAVGDLVHRARWAKTESGGSEWGAAGSGPGRTGAGRTLYAEVRRGDAYQEEGDFGRLLKPSSLKAIRPVRRGTPPPDWRWPVSVKLKSSPAIYPGRPPGQSASAFFPGRSRFSQHQYDRYNDISPDAVGAFYRPSSVAEYPPPARQEKYRRRALVQARYLLFPDIQPAAALPAAVASVFLQ